MGKLPRPRGEHLCVVFSKEHLLYFADLLKGITNHLHLDGAEGVEKKTRFNKTGTTIIREYIHFKPARLDFLDSTDNEKYI